VITSFMHRHRRAIVWLCAAAALLLGAQAQLHGLSHAVQAVQASAHHGPLSLHGHACEQCLLYAGLDGAAPTTALAPAALADNRVEAGAPVTLPRAAVFTAYISRAPPPAG
jgi:hypothetical protein